MKTLSEYSADALTDILNGWPEWEFDDGYRWDLDWAVGYTITHEEEDEVDRWFLSFQVAGPDHGLTVDDEIGDYPNLREAKLAAYQHAANENARVRYAEDRYMEMMAAEGPHPDDIYPLEDTI